MYWDLGSVLSMSPVEPGWRALYVLPEEKDKLVEVRPVLGWGIVVTNVAESSEDNAAETEIAVETRVQPLVLEDDMVCQPCRNWDNYEFAGLAGPGEDPEEVLAALRAEQ